jgi:ubiquinone/menaquinone biosynthesis C-methylase UbiE
MTTEEPESEYSGYSAIDATRDPESYLRKLDQRGATEFWQGIKRRMLGYLELRPGAQVIDIGCGAGDDVREMAEIVGPRGRAVGVDLSRIMIGEARRRWTDHRLPAEFIVAEAMDLPFTNATFDGCRMERVLQHLPDPARVMREVFRIAKSGARVVAVEPDYGATVIDGANAQLTQKLIAVRSSHYKSGRVGMLLALLMRDAGFEQIRLNVSYITDSSVGREQQQSLMENYVRPAVVAGVITQSEGAEWVEDLKVASLEQRYQHRIPIFMATGQKMITRAMARYE